MVNSPYVYKLTDIKTGEFYIGVRYANTVTPELDLGIKYFSSSKVIKQRGFLNFEKEIVQTFNNKNSAIDLESKLIEEAWGNPLLLNRHNKGVKFKNDTPRPEWLKEKLSILNKGSKKGPMTDEHKNKISAGNRGKTIASGRKPLSDNTKLKMRQAKLGRPFTRTSVTCIYCGKIMDKGNHSKHHGLKCKLNLQV